MPYCHCSPCGNLFAAATLDFGRPFECPSCGRSEILDAVHLARFEVPDRIDLQVCEADGRPWEGPPIPVLLKRGFYFPPLRTDDGGRLAVTRETSRLAELDAVSTDLMTRHDYSTHRVIEISVTSTADGLATAGQRQRSGWPILPFEQRLYRNLETLLAAYVSPADARVVTAHATIDLEPPRTALRVVLPVRRAS